MNCEIISKTKPEVTSPIPSCRRGDKMTSPSPPVGGGRLPLKGLHSIYSPPTGGVRGGPKPEGVTRDGNFNQKIIKS